MKASLLFLFSGIIFFSACSSNGTKGGSAVEERPNIILIMVDDLGYECLGSYGGQSYETPNLDQLAREGLRFTHAFAQPLCTNTRTELMTGKYLHHNWVAFGILDPAERTFGHLMSEQGYATCITGKWQLQSYDPPDYPGAEKRRGKGMLPSKAGFDEYCLWHTGHTEEKGSRYADPHIDENGAIVPGMEGRYGPDYFTAYLNDFVRRKKDEPFFIYYPMALTHDPFVPTPDSEDWKKPGLRHTKNTSYFGDMVSYCDKLVGEIIQNLVELDLEEKTLVLFYTDNGTHQTIWSEINGSKVQGGKGLTIDAGIRVPMIAYWKGQIDRGRVSDDLVYACDFLPTLIDMAGAKLPESYPGDGRSFLPVLEGRKGYNREWVYTDFNPLPGWGKDQFKQLRYVLNREYKLYANGDFYRWSDDLLENTPLSPQSLDKNTLDLRAHFQNVLDSIPASVGN